MIHSRRAFLASSIACSLAGFTGIRGLRDHPIPGALHGANHSIAHRAPTLHPAPDAPRSTTELLILGGGVAGLSAARRARSAGVQEITIVELESALGGNSLGGQNSVSAYPWGAHYLPLPNNSNTALLHLLEECGVASLEAKPRYHEQALCAAPQERLYIYGKWQEGLMPHRGLEASTVAETHRFHAMMEEMRWQRGRDGLFLFEIPLERSSQDPEILALDTLTMQRWLSDNGFRSPELHWYVNYCCRDDYGTTYDQTSAWAGLHYFCSRRAEPLDANPENVLTWSEGNFWLIEQMRSRLALTQHTGAAVFALEQTPFGWDAHCIDGATEQQFIVSAKSCIAAVPGFVRNRLLARARSPHSYAPWIVANITLSRPPAGAGAALSWDNVIYGSPLLGYVHAKHQSLQSVLAETVITYYYPLSELPPDTARMLTYHSTLSDLQQPFLKELGRVHPELSNAITRMDLWIWGHAMIRPTPGTITGLRAEGERLPRGLFAAHNDQSGISIFEQAFYRGIVAAEEALKHLQIRSESWV